MKSLEVSHLANIELFDYPRHKELKNEIYNTLLNYEDKQNHETNVKATMTEWAIESPEIKKLKEYIINALKDLPNRLKWGRAGDFKFRNVWANIYRFGDHTISHNHVPEDLTMVYFVTSNKEDTPLIMDDSETKIYPKEGLIVLFPGYLSHSVPEHMFNHERMTISGDINRVRPLLNVPL